MSSPNSPYHGIEGAGSSFEPTYHTTTVSSAIANLEDTHFDSSISHLDVYELGFDNFYQDAPEDAAIPSFLPNLSYYPQTSEPDLSDALTPASLHHPPIDFSRACSQGPQLSPLSTNLEFPLPRPQSSSSVLRPAPRWTPEPDNFTPSQGLGIHEATSQITPASTPGARHTHSTSSVSDSQANRRYKAIAPNPIGLLQLQSQKRSLSDDGYESPSPAPKKRKRSVSPIPSAEISEEDAFLLKLKDEEQLSWRDIAVRFQEDMGKAFQIPALQMRLKRLRERMRRWTETDLQALRMAHEFWATNKFDIISAKMSEFGATEKWSPKHCNKKWQEIALTIDHVYNINTSNQMFRTPTFLQSYTSSPVDAPSAGYYPFAVTSSS